MSSLRRVGEDGFNQHKGAVVVFEGMPLMIDGREKNEPDIGRFNVV